MPGWKFPTAIVARCCCVQCGHFIDIVDLGNQCHLCCTVPKKAQHCSFWGQPDLRFCTHSCIRSPSCSYFFFFSFLFCFFFWEYARAYENSIDFNCLLVALPTYNVQLKCPHEYRIIFHSFICVKLCILLWMIRLQVLSRLSESEVKLVRLWRYPWEEQTISVVTIAQMIWQYSSHKVNFKISINHEESKFNETQWNLQIITNFVLIRN